MLLLPAWVAIGRGFFGAGGWYFFVTVPIIGPALFIGLLIAYLLLRGRADLKTRQLMPRVETVLFLITYVGSFLFGFFLEDGGDTEESIGSAFTKLFRMGSEPILAGFAMVALAAAAISLGGLIVYAAYKRLAPRLQHKKQTA